MQSYRLVVRTQCMMVGHRNKPMVLYRADGPTSHRELGLAKQQQKPKGRRKRSGIENSTLNCYSSSNGLDSLNWTKNRIFTTLNMVDEIICTLHFQGWTWTVTVDANDRSLYILWSASIQYWFSISFFHCLFLPYSYFVLVVVVVMLCWTKGFATGNIAHSGMPSLFHFISNACYRSRAKS